VSLRVSSRADGLYMKAPPIGNARCLSSIFLPSRLCEFYKVRYSCVKCLSMSSSPVQPRCVIRLTLIPRQNGVAVLSCRYAPGRVGLTRLPFQLQLQL
jgi:hypothetical protein